MSSAHTKTKKPKSVNLCSAQLISAHLRRAHGQKTNKKTGPCSCTSGSENHSHISVPTHFVMSLLNVLEKLLTYIRNMLLGHLLETKDIMFHRSDEVLPVLAEQVPLNFSRVKIMTLTDLSGSLFLRRSLRSSLSAPTQRFLSCSLSANIST